MAIVERRAVRLVAQDRALAAIGARVPAHKEALIGYRDLLRRVVGLALLDGPRLDMLIEAVGAIARYDQKIATRLAGAIPVESKRGRRPRRSWQEEEVLGLYDFFVKCAEARSERYPMAVARRDVASGLQVDESVVRDVVKGRSSSK